MTELKFIVAKEKNDLETIVLLADTIWREHYRDILSQGQIDYMLTNFQSYAAIKKTIDGGETYYIIEYGGLPVGYCGIVYNGKKLYLDKLYILKESRGMKIGGATAAFIFDTAKKHGCDAVYLTVNKYNTDSIRAYRSIGFVTESAVNTDIGGGYIMDDYQMYKYL